MKKSLKRAVAVSAVCAAGLAGTLTTTATTATAGSSAKKASAESVTNFGMKALAYGTKVNVGGIDVKSLKDAKIVTACTRATGIEHVQPSTLSTEQIKALLGESLPVDIAELIHLSASTSRTLTYQEGDVTGVRATNVLGDIKIGGQVIEDISLPTITFTGLTSVADSFYDPADLDGDGKKFGTAESFDFGGLTIDLPEDGVVGETLQTLFDVIGVDPADVYEPVNAGVNDLLEALQEVTTTLGLDFIEIPGLGTIGLGKSFHKITDGFASSGASALEVSVNPNDVQNGDVALLKLGNAQSRIGSPAPSGVFRSTIMGLDFKALPLTEDLELLHMGGIGTESIPCEGTDGKTVTKAIEGTRTIPLGITDGVNLGVATLEGLEYAYSAEQLAGGRAKSMAQSKLGKLTLPAFGLEITGIASKLNLRSQLVPGTNGTKIYEVKGSKKPEFKVLTITQDGENLIPAGGLKIGQTITFVTEGIGDGTGFITFGPRVTRNHYGAKMTALSVKIGDLASLDLGWLESQIYPK